MFIANTVANTTTNDFEITAELADVLSKIGYAGIAIIVVWVLVKLFLGAFNQRQKVKWWPFIMSGLICIIFINSDNIPKIIKIVMALLKTVIEFFMSIFGSLAG